jgi:hypothetical protein
MLKPMLKLIRNRGRGVKAPASVGRANPLSLVRTARGYLFAGAGVVVAAVALISVLTWMGPDSEKPIPSKVIDHFLPGVVEQVDSKVATTLAPLLRVDKGLELPNVHTALASVREGLGTALRPASASPLTPSLSPPHTTSMPSTPMPTSKEAPSATNATPAPVIQRAASPPATDAAPTTSDPIPPPATSGSTPPPTTSDPPPPPPTTDPPSPPPTTDPPSPPPTTDPPSPPPTTDPPPPPPTTSPPPPPTTSPPSPPPNTGLPSPTTGNPLPPYERGAKG